MPQHPIKPLFPIRSLAFLLVCLPLWTILSVKSHAQINHDLLLGDTSIIAYPKSYSSSLRKLLLPVTVGSWILRSEDRNYSRRLGENRLTSHRYWYDAPLAALPLASLYTLKLAGVPSKSEWKRTLVGNASGFTVAVGISQILKSSVRSVRPDGTAKNSFPSDHALLAFASAAMLDEEYGHLSPWISVGGYTVATASAFTRVNNNRHWIGDVLNAYTLGTAAARIGYLAADIMQQGSGIRLKEAPFLIQIHKEKPSYLGTYSSAIVSLGHSSFQNTDLYFKTGYGAGVEGAWFWNARLGIGGKAGVSYFLPKINDVPQTFSVDYMDYEAGLYYNIPLKNRWNIGFHVLEGYHQIIRGESHIRQKGIDISRLHNGTIGFSLDYRAKKHLSSRLFCDYSCFYNDFHLQKLSIGITTCYRI